MLFHTTLWLTVLDATAEAPPLLESSTVAPGFGGVATPHNGVSAAPGVSAGSAATVHPSPPPAEAPGAPSTADPLDGASPRCEEEGYASPDALEESAKDDPPPSGAAESNAESEEGSPVALLDDWTEGSAATAALRVVKSCDFSQVKPPAGCVSLRGSDEWLWCWYVRSTPRDRIDYLRSNIRFAVGFDSCGLTEEQIQDIAARCGRQTESAKQILCAMEAVRSGTDCSKNQVCRHYAHSYQAVAEAMGLQSARLCGVIAEVGHCWNEVPTHDGGKYLIDSYNDIALWCPSLFSRFWFN